MRLVEQEQEAELPAEDIAEEQREPNQRPDEPGAAAPAAPDLHGSSVAQTKRQLRGQRQRRMKRLVDAWRSLSVPQACKRMVKYQWQRKLDMLETCVLFDCPHPSQLFDFASYVDATLAKRDLLVLLDMANWLHCVTGVCVYLLTV